MADVAEDLGAASSGQHKKTAGAAGAGRNGSGKARRRKSPDDATAAGGAPAAPAPRASLMARIDAFVTLVVKALGFVTLLVTLLAAVGYVVRNRGAVRIAPFQVPAGLEQRFQGPLLAAQLGQTLDAVREGAEEFFEKDTHFSLASDTPPQITIPGAGISIASLVSSFQVGPFAETQVHATLVQTPAEPASAEKKEGFRILVEVHGPSVEPQTIATSTKADVDAAIVESAESLYRILRPTAFAAYSFRRHTEDARAAIQSVLARPTQTPTEDRANAYRIWGVLLRDQRDYVGAREKLAIALTLWQGLAASGPPLDVSSRAIATTYVDLGHTAFWQKKWARASTAYRRAIDADPRWAAPYRYLGDALRKRSRTRDLEPAVAVYQQAIAYEPLSGDAHSGLGSVLMKLGRRAEAESALTEASRLATTGELTLLVHHYLARIVSAHGDDAEAAGRHAEACAHYRHAVDLELIFGPDPDLEGVRRTCEGAIT